MNRQISTATTTAVSRSTVFLALSMMLVPISAEEIEYRHGISLMHELKYSSDFEHFDYLNPDAPKGGAVNLATTWEVLNFTWWLDTVVKPADGLFRTYDSLMQRSGDELAALYGSLAKGVAISADRSRLYFELHPLARWHDGEPITVEDVKFTFDAAVKTLDGGVYLPWLKETQIVGDHQIMMRHEERFTDVNIYLIGGLVILPEKHWRGRDPVKVHTTPSVGSGPYRVGPHTRTNIEYQRDPDYWGKDLPINRGRYNFDKIRYELYRDEVALRESFKKGLLDVHFETDIRHWTESFNTPALARGHIIKDTFPNDKIGATFSICFNTGKEIFSDIRVREALALAMDFEWQNRVIQHGSQTRATSFFANSIFASSGLPSRAELELLTPYRDQLPERIFTTVYKLPVTDGKGRHEASFEQARELLMAAGWTIQNGRLANDKGEPFEFEFITWRPQFKRTLIPYTDSLKRLGINATIRLVDSAQLNRRRRGREFDALMIERWWGQPATMFLRSRWHSSAAGPGNMTGNITEMTIPAVDFLVERAEQAVSLATLTTTLRALDRVALWQFHSVLLNTVEDNRMLRWDRFGRPRREIEGQLQWPYIDGWWFDADKASHIVNENQEQE